MIHMENVVVNKMWNRIRYGTWKAEATIQFTKQEHTTTKSNGKSIVKSEKVKGTVTSHSCNVQQKKNTLYKGGVETVFANKMTQYNNQSSGTMT